MSPAPGVQGLRSRFEGPLIGPGEDGYDEVRKVWNGAIDRRPALIARCAGAADVVEAVRFARERDLLVSIRAGGHNVAGTGVVDDGLMIDLSLMKGVSVDPAGRVARAGAGVLWGEFDRATQAAGLAAPGGVVSHTGVAGLTLGGGIGWLMRKHGLTSDRLRSAELVTADGERLRASAEENPELFWGLGGGGGNFGIVTSFEFGLEPLGPTVAAGIVVHDADRAPEVLEFVRGFAASAPEELTVILYLRNAPAAPFLPEAIHGRPVLNVGACYAGPVEEGMALLQPLKEWGPPLVDLLEPKAYVAHQSAFDLAVPHGLRYYWKSHYVADLSPDVTDVLASGSWPLPTPSSYTIVFLMGGAVGRFGDDETAFGSGRSAGYAVNVNAVAGPGEDFETAVAWCRESFRALEPHASGVYVNFLDQEGQDRVVLAYGQRTFDRLRALKTRYDPDNFFRVNQNIPPV